VTRTPDLLDRGERNAGGRHVHPGAVAKIMEVKPGYLAALFKGDSLPPDDQEAIAGPLVATINNFLATELNIQMDQPYAAVSEERDQTTLKTCEGGHMMYLSLLSLQRMA
jgi:hypothetical protein